MAGNSTLANLPAASALTGPELFYGTQSGGDVKVTATQIQTFTGLTVGTTTITGGTTTRLLYDLAGVVSETAALTYASSALTNTQAIGNASTDGYILLNSTAATVGAQKWSPRLRFTGQGWQTNSSGSQTVDWIVKNQPVQGAAAPTSNLVLSVQINGGGYTSPFKFLNSGFLLFTNGANAGALGISNAGNIFTAFDSTINNYIDIFAQAYGLLDTGSIKWTTGAESPGTYDLFLRRGGAATLQLGSTDAASPVAQTLQVQSANTVNNAGVTWTLFGSMSAGWGVSGGITLQTGVKSGVSGTKATPTTALTIKGETQAVQLASASQLNWNADTILLRDAANVVGQRNGTTAQALQVYNTYTDGSNYERGLFGWTAVANRLSFRTVAAGTGTERDIEFVSGANGGQIQMQSNGNIYFNKSNTGGRWQIDTNGMFIAQTDNAFDIGANAATRPRDAYIAGAVVQQNLNSLVTTQFDATTNTTLANITGLTATLIASGDYAFIAVLHITADAVGGWKTAIGGTATVTSFVQQTEAISDTSNSIAVSARDTTKGNAQSAAVDTSYYITITGRIKVANAGTLTAQFAQKVSNGTSSVLIGSSFLVTRVS